jgi:hypothetical protein
MLFKPNAGIVLLSWLIVACILLAPMAYSEDTDDLVIISIGYDGREIYLSDAVVLNYMDVYDLAGATLPSVSDPSPYEVIVKDAQGNILYQLPFNDLDNGMPLEKVRDLSSVEVVFGSEVEFSQMLSLCNHDGVCQACGGSGCVLAEDILGCDDCRSGGADRYCDGIKDSICDPDCGGLMDADCGRTCDGSGGELCTDKEICVGGSLQTTVETGYCCMGGRCVSAGEYVETIVEMQNQPSLTITAEGMTAASVQQHGKDDYCRGILGGIVCEPDEYCDGKNIEHYFGASCCVGDCILYPSVGNVTWPTLSEYLLTEQNVSSAFGVFVQPAPEIYEGLPAGEFPHEALSGVLEEAPPAVSGIEQIGAAAQSVVDKVDWVYVVVIALSTLIVIFILVGIFRKSASARTSGEEKQAYPDLQAEIDSLAAQGDDYRKIEAVLVQKGFEKSVVDSEIRKNYQKRVEAQAKK